MVHEGNLAYALPIFSADAPATIESDYDVGSLVLHQFCVCRALRCGGHLFLRLAGISLSGICVFLFNWIAPGRRSLDSGALYLRFRPGNVQLLRANQSRSAKHGLSQRAPRSALDPVEQFAETARNGAGILQQPEVSLIVESV